MHRILRLAVDVRPREIRALFWSFAYFFSILCAYYILRPLRDEMGIAGGVRALPWMFTGTFVAMLCVVPVFGAIVARFPRRKFIPYVYWFFIANILLFWLLFTLGAGKVYVARAFFIWTSVFNLFIVSVFWSFMVDLYRAEQTKRLFGFIAAGGTVGTIVGPAVTALMVVRIEPTHLLLLSALLLAIALVCVRRIVGATAGFKVSPEGGGKSTDEAVIGGGMFAGVSEIVKSRYLLGICIFVAMFTTTSTFVYFQQANIIADAFDDSGQRTQVFAFIDLSVSVLTIVTQLAITGRFIRYLGVAAAVAFLPLVTTLGFLFFALAPTITMLIAFQIVRRASNYAITRPGREMLYTVVSREQKYKSKNFIDTVVYRGGDAVSGWAFTGLSAGLGLEIGVIAGICVPFAGLWMALGWVLGRQQNKLSVGDDAEKPGLAPAG